MLAAIKRWWSRRRQELAAQRQTLEEFDALTDNGFLDRLGK